MEEKENNINNIMDIKKDLQEIYGIRKLNESKYGHKLDQYYGPFRADNKKVKDKNSKELCECVNQDLAKELAALLTDIKQLRELCDKIISLPNR